ncbi:MAG: hypothetical protein P1V97_37815 [Planctomycetota bacterium]|nr:hypothetical protein [Planctomycetota bacterium]
MKSGIAALLCVGLAVIIVVGVYVLNKSASTSPNANSQSNKTGQNSKTVAINSIDRPQEKSNKSEASKPITLPHKKPKKPIENNATEQPLSFPAKTINSQNSPIKEATPEDLDELESLVLERDGPGLLSFFKKNKSIARFEALRRFMEVQGQESIPVLIDLLKTEEDPGLHGVLGDALGAGAQSIHIPAMSLALQGKLPSTARLALASAFSDLSERLHPASQRQCQNLALKELRILVKDKEWGEAAISQLPACGPEGLSELESIAANNSISDSNRLLAATILAPRQGALALKTFQDLAKNSKNTEIRAVATQYAARLSAGK